jgi:diguanylate cyclase (GGDEF)-like protein/PAS domain S-box-containing protein
LGFLASSDIKLLVSSPMNGVERASVADHAELLESALDALGEGVALADMDGRLAFWNGAAEGITGWKAGEVVERRVRQVLDSLVVGGAPQWIRHSSRVVEDEHGSPIPMRHKLGHEFPVVAHVLELRDYLGIRIGTGVLFHPAEKIDALPIGETSRDSKVGESRMQLEERLARMHEDFRQEDSPLGVLWVAVDQGPELRRSHGARACQAMLETAERTLATGLKPAEEIGRWGDQEFLILSHERSAGALADHAQRLTGLARTAEFRWWGDRISLTVSIGAAQAEPGENLCALLERAQAGMLASIRAGGNHITAARRNR